MRFSILFVLFFFLGQVCSAQTFSNYTINDGLINDAVICLALDANENLWFGTQEGISFFDGNSWVNFDQSNVPELNSNTIQAIFVDGDNNLWVGSDFGINKFDGTLWSSFDTEDGLEDDRIKYINQDANGLMWFAHNDGVSTFDGNDWINYTSADGIPFGGTNFVTFDQDGKVCLGNPLFGALIFDGIIFDLIDTNDGLIANNVRSIAIDRDNNKWIGTAEGISVFDEDNMLLVSHEDMFSLPPPHTINPVEDVAISCNGEVWVAVYADYLVTEGGIAKYAENEWVDYNEEDGLTGPVVRRIVTDSQNTIWIATSTGVTKIENSECISSIEEGQTLQTMVLYPNPVEGILVVDMNGHSKDIGYYIVDILGRRLVSGSLKQGNNTLDLNDFDDGLYMLCLDNGTYRKFIKK